MDQAIQGISRVFVWIFFINFGIIINWNNYKRNEIVNFKSSYILTNINCKIIIINLSRVYRQPGITRTKFRVTYTSLGLCHQLHPFPLPPSHTTYTHTHLSLQSHPRHVLSLALLSSFRRTKISNHRVSRDCLSTIVVDRPHQNHIYIATHSTPTHTHTHPAINAQNV